MKSVNALQLRQSLGKVIRELEEDGAPVRVCRGRKPAAVLVSLKDYRERFVDRDADDRRRAVVTKLKATRVGRSDQTTTLDLLRGLRGQYLLQRDSLN